MSVTQNASGTGHAERTLPVRPNSNKEKAKTIKITTNGFVSSNHFFPANPAPFITKIYTLLHLHFQNFLRKLEVLAMPSSFTARLITLTTIPVVSITVVVVSGPA
jgi:hypothetical protein